MTACVRIPALTLAIGLMLAAVPADAQDRPRARDLGIEIGRFKPGPLNALTDVNGVKVGHYTLIRGDSIRTGVTAVLPHGGNVFTDKVRGAIVVRNGFGKLVGISQVNELGWIETPILLTGTLSVFRVADALADTLLRMPGMDEVRSINPVAGETNDGFLSDIRARPIEPEHVRAALRAGSDGPVEEGTVGAGTGTRALGWKGGIGTSSRVLPDSLGGYTVGVLVQTNYGGNLTVVGVPVGRYLRAEARQRPQSDDRDGGSVMIIVATDAPLSHRNLTRLAERTFAGVARTGSYMSHGSGDYAIAFSTERRQVRDLDGEVLTSLFIAVAESAEEAVLNSLFRAVTVNGYHGTAEAIPIDDVLKVLAEHNR